jgi:hypothetical protein
MKDEKSASAISTSILQTPQQRSVSAREFGADFVTVLTLNRFDRVR